MRSDERPVLRACRSRHVQPHLVRRARAASLTEEALGRAAGLFKLLGDPTRTRLLYALLETGELCVCDLAAATDTLEATVSQALRQLRGAGVVTSRREGRQVFYRLADAHVRTLLDLTRDHVLEADEDAVIP